jgi:hypothetical protein
VHTVGPVFLAELIGFRLLDRRDRRYRLVDLAIDTNGAEEPTIQRLLLRGSAFRRHVVEIPADLVERIDVDGRTIRVGADPRRERREAAPAAMRPS